MSTRLCNDTETKSGRFAVATLVSKDYCLGALNLLASLDSNLKYPFDVLVYDIDLSDNFKKILYRAAPSVNFRSIEPAAYRDIDMSSTIPHLRSSFYKLEMFKETAYDRILFVDADAIVLRDISMLFEIPCKFGACEAYDRKRDRIVRSEFNGGVLLLSREVMQEEVYVQLMNSAIRGDVYMRFAEQGVLNAYFQHTVHWLPKLFNVEKRFFLSESHRSIFDAAHIVHYVNEKPWAKKKSDLSMVGSEAPWFAKLAQLEDSDISAALLEMSTTVQTFDERLAQWIR